MRARGLRDHCDRQLGALRRLAQPFFQLLGIREDERMAAPARDGLDLRVRRRADDDGLTPLVLGRRDQAVDALDGRAGRVDDLDRPRQQRLVDRTRHAVRADHNRRAVGNLLGRGDGADAQRLEMRHKMAVVRDRPIGHGRLAAPRGLFDQIDRAVHAVAEPGGACLHDLHRSSPMA